jgi:hypothetical protein
MTKKSLKQYRYEITVKTCRWCDTGGLDAEDIQHYDHEGGWPVMGFTENQWLYIICPGCEYEWALWKLGVVRG